MPSKKRIEQPLRRSSRLTRLSETPVAAVPEKNGRKRKPSPDNKPEEKIKPKKYRPEIDSFCWICHKQTQEEICLICSRVYHRSCLNRSNQFTPEGACAECQLESLDGTKLSKALTVGMLKELLSYATQIAFRPKFKNQKSFQQWPAHRNNKKLFCQMDGKRLLEKIHGVLPFTKTAEFYSDAKWIYHNCCIIYGKDSKETRLANEILKILKLELQAIEACPWCYELQNTDTEFFVQVCKEPHTILWAKLKGFPYWPAKCLKVINGMADVRFFGTHDRARIPANNCYLLSESSPNKSVKDVRYKFAKEELDRYIANYKRKYDSFQYAPLRTVFEPGSANQLPIKRAAKGKRNKKSAAPQVTREILAANSRGGLEDGIAGNSDYMGIPSQSHPDDAVSVCMTFAAYDEGNNENIRCPNDNFSSELESSKHVHASPSLPVVTALNCVLANVTSAISIKEQADEIAESEDNEYDAKPTISSSGSFIIQNELTTSPDAEARIHMPSEDQSGITGPVITHLMSNSGENYMTQDDDNASCTAVEVITVSDTSLKRSEPEVIVIDDDDDEPSTCVKSVSARKRQTDAFKYVYRQVAQYDGDLYNFVLRNELNTDKNIIKMWSSNKRAFIKNPRMHQDVDKELNKLVEEIDSMEAKIPKPVLGIQQNMKRVKAIYHLIRKTYNNSLKWPAMREESASAQRELENVLRLNRAESDNLQTNGVTEHCENKSNANTDSVEEEQIHELVLEEPQSRCDEKLDEVGKTNTEDTQVSGPEYRNKECEAKENLLSESLPPTKPLGKPSPSLEPLLPPSSEQLHPSSSQQLLSPSSERLTSPSPEQLPSTEQWQSPPSSSDKPFPSVVPFAAAMPLVRPLVLPEKKLCTNRLTTSLSSAQPSGNEVFSSSNMCFVPNSSFSGINRGKLYYGFPAVEWTAEQESAATNSYMLTQPFFQPDPSLIQHLESYYQPTFVNTVTPPQLVMPSVEHATQQNAQFKKTAMHSKK